MNWLINLESLTPASHSIQRIHALICIAGSARQYWAEGQFDSKYSAVQAMPGTTARTHARRSASGCRARPRGATGAPGRTWPPRA